MGHLANTCWSKKRLSQNESANRKYKREYFKCRQVGHIARFCNKTCNAEEDNNVTAMIAVPTALPLTESPLKVANGY